MATTKPVVEGPIPPPPSESSAGIDTPSSTSSAQTPEIVAVAPTEELPTESHQLAHAKEGEGLEELGVAQVDHGHTEVRDLGWNEDPKNVPPLVGGLPNEELWTLLRRFNKVNSTMHHARTAVDKMRLLIVT